MSAIVTIVSTTAKRLRGERRLPFFVIGLPILVMLLVGTIFGTGTRRLVVGVVAPDGDPAAAAVVEAIDRSPLLKPRHFDSTSSARRNVRRGRITAAVLVPEGYGRDVAIGRTGDVTVVVQPGRSDSFEARMAASAVLARVNVTFVVARAIQEETGAPFVDAVQRARRAAVDVPEVLGGDDDESPFAYTAPSNLVLFAFITALVTSAQIVDARRSGVTRRVLASPTRPSAVVVAELVTAFFTALFQASLMLVVGSVFFGVGFGSPLAVAALILALSLAAAAAGSLLATFVRTPEQSISFGPAIGIALGMLGGTMWPLDDVSPLLRAIGHLTPQAWAMDGFVNLIFDEAGFADIAGQLGVLLLMAVALLTLATTRLRRAILVS